MTRFARAKGSKSSNERAPEDGTPWEVMKEQLLYAKKESEESKKRHEAEQQRINNYEKFLKEQKVQKRKATWCDFPETAKERKNIYKEQPVKKKKKEQNSSIGFNSETTGNVISEVTSNETNITTETKSNKKKKNKNKQKSDSTVVTETIDNESSNNFEKSEILDNSPTKKKKKNKKTQEGSTASVTGNNDLIINSEKNSKKKYKIRKFASEPIITSQTDNANSKSEDVNENISENVPKEGHFSNLNKQNKAKASKKKKNKKLIDGAPVRRKIIDDNSFQIIINGKEVELVRYDGFPIMKKDAERLAELKSNMIKKGIPKSEVQRTMKLERRRAEKALARVRREVCYNCRKGGHNLSDCPELKSKIPGADVADGVCFKCGSTEHRQFECKVQRDKEFRFATCFICKEQGHIARQCPDNPKGLYPNGGGCKLCGDVTHLRKDCPTASNKKEETSVKLQTLDSTDDIEDIGRQKISVSEDCTKKPKKIKF